MLKDFPANMLKDSPQQLSTLKKLKNNFELLLKIYYYYCLIQNPSQFSIPFSDLIIRTKFSSSSSFRITYSKLPDLCNASSWSNNT